MTRAPAGQPLSLADAVRYHMSTARNPMEIGIVLFLSDRMEPATLRRLVRERLLAHERFRQSVARAPFPLRPRWLPEADFSADEHIACTDGPALSRTELAEHLARRLSTRLPADRSPWRMELLPLRDGGCALHLRVHHCLGDGLSLVRLLCEIADEPRPALPRSLPRASRKARAQLPSPHQLLRRAEALRRTLVETVLSRADSAADLHEPCGSKRMAWSCELDLGELSRLAEAHACHVTDLLLSATADAMGRGLAAAGRDVPSQLRALVPTGATLGRRELGNHYASAFVELVLDEPDAGRRIERMSRATRKLQDGAHTRVARNLIGLAGWLAPPVMRRALRFMSRRASLVVSNVPGPAERVRLYGHEVRSLVVFAPPAASIGVSFTVFGYAGALRVGVQTDAAVPLSPEQLVRDFERALRTLTSPQTVSA